MAHSCSQMNTILITTKITTCGLRFSGISLKDCKGVSDTFLIVLYEIATFDSLKTVEYQRVYMAQPHRSLRGKEI